MAKNKKTVDELIDYAKNKLKSDFIEMEIDEAAIERAIKPFADILHEKLTELSATDTGLHLDKDTTYHLLNAFFHQITDEKNISKKPIWDQSFEFGSVWATAAKQAELLNGAAAKAKEKTEPPVAETKTPETSSNTPTSTTETDKEEDKGYTTGKRWAAGVAGAAAIGIGAGTLFSSSEVDAETGERKGMSFGGKILVGLGALVGVVVLASAITGGDPIKAYKAGPDFWNKLGGALKAAFKGNGGAVSPG